MISYDKKCLLYDNICMIFSTELYRTLVAMTHRILGHSSANSRYQMDCDHYETSRLPAKERKEKMEIT